MNIVIVTSVINAEQSFFSNEERLNQLVNKTIPSILDKIPNPYIVLLEGSILTDNQLLILNKLKINEIHYYKTYNCEKSLGEVILISSFLTSESFYKIENKINNLIKISGRYYLLDEFNFNINSKNVIKKDHNRKVCETRYYKIVKDQIIQFKNSIISLRNNGIFHDLEHSFYQYDIVPTINDIDRIYIGGNLGPNGEYTED